MSSQHVWTGTEWVLRSEWQARQNAVRRAEARAANAEAALNQARAEAARNEQNLQNLFSRQVAGLSAEMQNQERRSAAALQQAQSSINARLYQQEQEHAAALRQAQDTFNRRIHEQGMREAEARRLLAQEQEEARRRLEQKFDAELRNQKQELQRELAATRTEMQNQITGIIHNMEAQRKTEAEIAAYWIDQARRRLNDIDGKYRHRLFAEGKWDLLVSNLNMAEGNIRHASQAALAGAQAVYNDALALEHDVIVAEAEWIEVFNRANLLLTEARNRVEGLETLVYHMPEGDVKAEIDWWTTAPEKRTSRDNPNGGISEVKRDIAALQEIISRRDIPLSTPLYSQSVSLQSAIAEIKHLDEKITGVETLGRNNFLASELRYTIGEEIASKLPGWRLAEDPFFRGEDDRNDLHLVFVHANNRDRLSFTIRGGEDGKTDVQSDLECISDRSMEARDRWMADINNAVGIVASGERGRCVQEYAQSPHGDLRAFDVEALKQPVTVAE